MGAHLPLAVGGQVLESGVDGRLLVHWADGFTSYCKPIDLFLITSDVRVAYVMLCYVSHERLDYKG